MFFDLQPYFLCILVLSTFFFLLLSLGLSCPLLLTEPGMTPVGNAFRTLNRLSFNWLLSIPLGQAAEDIRKAHPVASKATLSASSTTKTRRLNEMKRKR